MASDRRAVRAFFANYRAAPVGPTPPQPLMPPVPAGDTKNALVIDRTVERPEAEWKPLTVPEQPARDGEFPVRFIDGSQTTLPVLCIRTKEGHPVPLVLGEVGAVALRLVGRGFEREYVALDRVLSFVADGFPWEDIEPFAADLLNSPELTLRFLPANTPEEQHDPFDYEVMRTQAQGRITQEMRTLERLAYLVNSDSPTLIDGPLRRVTGTPRPGAPLLVGVVKRHSVNYLHPAGRNALLDLRPGQRTPAFTIAQPGNVTTASWYLKLAGGPRLAPNWGYVRVDVPLSQYPGHDRDGFVHRLSRWLIDARCRTDSYARMPVSLDPIVRAEDALKPLFTPLPLLATRLYRTAGLFQRGDL